MAYLDIPVVDFTSWSSSDISTQTRLAKEFTEACTKYGCVYVTGTGLSDERIAEQFQWMKKFFGLEHEKKMLARHADGKYVFRGYMPAGQEKLEANSAAPDTKVSYAVAHERMTIVSDTDSGELRLRQRSKHMACQCLRSRRCLPRLPCFSGQVVSRHVGCDEGATSCSCHRGWHPIRAARFLHQASQRRQQSGSPCVLPSNIFADPGDDQKPTSTTPRRLQ
jgi:isopenicillin N synthase-like dioxygenase